MVFAFLPCKRFLAEINFKTCTQTFVSYKDSVAVPLVTAALSLSLYVRRLENLVQSSIDRDMADEIDKKNLIEKFKTIAS